MKLYVQGDIIEIEDRYIEYSPLLSVLQASEVPVDMVEDAVILDVDLHDFTEYKRFLEGDTFTLDVFTATLFDYMGHNNHMGYPIDVWAMKLHDNWVRDNFYRHELWKDPLYDLIQIPIIRKCPVDVPKGWYVAGGAALWMAGVIDKLNDIDLFTSMNKKDAVESLLFLNDGHELAISGNSITWNDRIYKVQFILRLYKSPSETVHGFDLDSVGILHLPETNTLWCTRRTMMSIEKKMNWFDPMRASPSYAYRLLKYRNRGFHIFLPLITIDDINMGSVVDYFSSIDTAYYMYIEEDYEYENIKINRIRSILSDLEDKDGMIHISYQSLMASIISTKRGKNRTISEMASYARSEVQFIKDPASLLILASLYDFYVIPGNSIKTSDYKTNKKKTPGLDDQLSRGMITRMDYNRLRGYEKYFDEDDDYVINFSILQWKEQDPMEQITTTCIPTPIGDLREWYKTSPLFKEGPNIIDE